MVESACSVRDLGLIPGSGRSPGEGNGNPLQYSCLENPKDRGAWWATSQWGHRVRHDWVTKSIYDDPMFNILGTVRWFSEVATLFYISTSNIWGLLFFHILTVTCLAFKMYSSLWTWRSVTSWFWFVFPSWLWCSTSFYVLSGHLNSLFGQLFRFLAYGLRFLNWVIYLFIVEFLEVIFIFSRWKSFVIYMTCKYFPQFSGFTFLIVSFESARVFDCEVQFI